MEAEKSTFSHLFRVVKMEQRKALHLQEKEENRRVPFILVQYDRETLLKTLQQTTPVPNPIDV